MTNASTMADMEVVDKALNQSVAEPGARPFSDEVRELRQRLGLTQEDFCQKFGIRLATLRNWEQPSRSTKPDTAARLLIAMIAVDPERVADIIAKTSNVVREPVRVRGAA